MPEAGEPVFQSELEELKRMFPVGKAYVDYRIKKEKLKLLWDIFNSRQSCNSDFDKFIQDSAYWINDFALYKVIKEHNQGKPWYEWEPPFRNHQRDILESFRKEHEKEIIFVMWVQWQLFKQFREIKKYAALKKVFLKGDLPILVSRDSADVWAHPEFFKLEFAAGAPQDMYAALGQRWGMATYDWDRIAIDGYGYLKAKLKYVQNFYDILRIDHVVGLFRIWSIPYSEPKENQGLKGFFDPPDEKRWEGQGRKILSVMLKNTKMLLCAEDLGVIPEVCTKALEDFSIPGSDVQRWMKDWKTKHDFLKPESYRRLSVAMLSTHDTTDWQAWWENEAGTVDEGLFMRRCSDHRQIDFGAIKDKLFDFSRSRHGRLRWQDSVDSVEKLVKGLSPQGTVPKEHLADFIDFYQNSFHEREKLWKHLKIKGPMREKSDPEILKSALKITLDAKAIFCINTIIDYLGLADILKGDLYPYRINTPGTISDKNWSLVMPISLEDLLEHKVCAEIKKMIAASGRI
jgi:4-alpha-glucanotransferase